MPVGRREVTDIGTVTQCSATRDSDNVSEREPSASRSLLTTGR